MKSVLFIFHSLAYPFCVMLLSFFLFFPFLILNYITYSGPFIVFSLHSSFLAAIFLFKLLTFNFSSVCVVLDDMPAHMFSASSPLFSFLKRLDSLVLKFFSFFVSHYILLSPHMKHLGFIKTKYNFMLEGFSSPLPSDITQSLNPTLLHILITRTLFMQATFPLQKVLLI